MGVPSGHAAPIVCRSNLAAPIVDPGTLDEGGVPVSPLEGWLLFGLCQLNLSNVFPSADLFLLKEMVCVTEEVRRSCDIPILCFGEQLLQIAPLKTPYLALNLNMVAECGCCAMRPRSSS